MECSPETKLNKQFPFSYSSFAGSSQLADGSGDLNRIDGDRTRRHATRGEFADGKVRRKKTRILR